MKGDGKFCGQKLMQDGESVTCSCVILCQKSLSLLLEGMFLNGRLVTKGQFSTS